MNARYACSEVKRKEKHFFTADPCPALSLGNPLLRQVMLYGRKGMDYEKRKTDFKLEVCYKSGVVDIYQGF